MFHTPISPRGLWAALVALLLTAGPASAQTDTYTWSTSTTSNAWLTVSNWTINSTTSTFFPGATSNDALPNGQLDDIAVIGSFNFTATSGLGIDMGPSGAQGLLTLGAIHFTSATANLRIGSSNANDNNDTLWLQGATIDPGSGPVNNVILANTSGSRNLIIDNTASGSGSQTMNVLLGVSGVMLVNSGRTITVNSNISEASPGFGITVQGGGTVVLAGANSFTGNTIVSGAGSTLSISADNNLGTAPGAATAGKIALSAGTLQATASFTLDANRGITIGNGGANSSGTIDVASGATLTYNGIIANNTVAAQLNKTGAGTLVLGGVNTYTNGTLITGGTVRVDNVGALSTGSIRSLKPVGTDTANLFLNVAGTLAGTITVGNPSDPGTGKIVLGTPTGLTGTAIFSGPFQVRRPVTIQAGASSSTQFTSVISTTGTTPADITISAPTAATTATRRVIFVQNASANTYGNITIGDAAGPHAVLQLGLATASNNNIVPDSSTISFFAAPGGGNGGSQLIIAPGSAATDGETIGALISLSPGAGTVTTTQPTTGVHVYTLTVGGGDQSGTFSGVVGEKALNPATAASLAIVKTGTGTQIFSGNNTYSPGTTINAGVLLVNGQTGSNSGTGTGAVTVNNTGTFGGTGRAAGAVTVNTGGTIRGGDATGVGTLTLGNSLTMASGANLGLRITDATVPSSTPGGSTIGTLPNPTSNNFINITSGTLSLNAAIQILVNGTGTAFNPSQTYSYQVGAVTGQDLSALSITNQSQFTAIGFSDPFSFALTGNGGGAVFLTMSPVPEPATVLSLAAGALGVGGFIRRRVVRRAV